MIVKKSFLIDDGVYSRLQNLAKDNCLPVGGMVRRLVDAFEGQPRIDTREYAAWLNAVVNHGRLFGDEAVQEFIKKYPAPR